MLWDLYLPKSFTTKVPPWLAGILLSPFLIICGKGCLFSWMLFVDIKCQKDRRYWRYLIFKRLITAHIDKANYGVVNFWTQIETTDILKTISRFFPSALMCDNVDQVILGIYIWAVGDGLESLAFYSEKSVFKMVEQVQRIVLVYEEYLRGLKF